MILPVPLLHVFLRVEDCHLLADSCAAAQLPVPAFLHIRSVLPVHATHVQKDFHFHLFARVTFYLSPVEKNRILANNSQLLALARPCKFGHIGGWEEVEGDGDATVDAHAEGQETGKGGEEEVGAEE